MIYIMGDSHVSVFSGTDKTHDGLRHIQPEFGTCYTLSKGSLRPHNVFEQKIPLFCPIKIGSNTAYNSVKRLPLIQQALDEYKVTKKDPVFLCFGEIDIRNHIGKNAELNDQTLLESIQICVNRYLVTILTLKRRGYNVGVYGPPASSVGWPETYGYKDVVTRNEMTLTFSDYLSNQCEKNGIPFVSIAKDMLLADNTTDQKYIMDDIHLSQQAMPLLINKFKTISNGY